MTKYKDNASVKRALKAFLVAQGIRHEDAAAALGMSRQSFSMILAKKNITPADMQKIANVAGYDLYFEFIKSDDTDEKK